MRPMPDDVIKTDRDGTKRRRVVSISFAGEDAEWVDGLVGRLRAVGYRHVSRSEVVNVALDLLRAISEHQTPYEVLKLFLDKARRRP